MSEDKKHKPSGYWTYERCKEVAKNCKRRTDFNRLNGSAYETARRNGWLDDFFPKAS